ncbi:MAG TPA: response regulator transcription factor [Terriglobales bacterium]|nr:response regulator transcription factor [Terriglobales bacterium]
MVVTSRERANTNKLVQQLRALVVEDYSPFLDYVCSTLQRRENVEIVGKAQNGLDAVERAKALQPDLIFLDIGMPGLNGIEAAGRIRTVAPAARIVFLTQESASEIVYEALSLGAWGYIHKPSVGQDLHRALEGILQGRKFVSEGLDGHAL